MAVEMAGLCKGDADLSAVLGAEVREEVVELEQRVSPLRRQKRRLRSK